jgi:hypothetical protein
MRARVTEFTTFMPTQDLVGPNGVVARVSRGVEMRLAVVATPEPGEVARMMGADVEVIIAPIPVRCSDSVTEGTLAKWANVIARGEDRDQAPEMFLAVRHLLPEVTALRYEVENLRREVKWLREREARPLVDKLKEIASHMGFDVEVADGIFTLKPKPNDDDERWEE